MNRVIACGARAGVVVESLGQADRGHRPRSLPRPPFRPFAPDRACLTRRPRAVQAGWALDGPTSTSGRTAWALSQTRDDLALLLGREPTSGGPVLTLARPRLLSPLHTGPLFLNRAGLSRRQLGWRGDLCAGVPAASGAGVAAVPAGRAAPRGVPARVRGALRQGARPAPSRRRARAARVPHLWPRRAWLRTPLVRHVPDQRTLPVFLPRTKLLPVVREKEAALVGRVAAEGRARARAASARRSHHAAAAARDLPQAARAPARPFAVRRGGAQRVPQERGRSRHAAGYRRLRCQRR